MSCLIFFFCWSPLMLVVCCQSVISCYLADSRRSKLVWLVIVSSFFYNKVFAFFRHRCSLVLFLHFCDCLLSCINRSLSIIQLKNSTMLFFIELSSIDYLSVFYFIWFVCLFLFWFLVVISCKIIYIYINGKLWKRN